MRFLTRRSSGKSKLSPQLRELLAASSASNAFVAAVSQFGCDRRSSDRIVYGPYMPAVKIDRVLCYLLEAHPECAIERVEFDAGST